MIRRFQIHWASLGAPAPREHCEETMGIWIQDADPLGWFVWNGQECIGTEDALIDALIDAEKTLREKLNEVQRLLTAEREKTRDDKPPSPTY
jgi:hypothetical protein